MALILHNPHSIAAALKLRPADVHEICVTEGQLTDAWKEVSHLAQRAGVACVASATVNEPSRRRQRRGEAAGRGGAAQAIVKDKAGSTLEALFAGAAELANGHGLWLALDQIQDPHNVGAIFRTAAFFGVKGVVLTRDRSAPLSAAVYDVASGGVEHVPFSVVPNLASALKQAKKSGLWVLGTSETATEDVGTIDRERPWLLVLGNEEAGLRRLTRDNCDAVCRISGEGELTSLNVSVAAGVLIATLSATRGESS